VILIVVLIVLLFGPRAKWVKRLLPNTANRVVFGVVISALILGWTIMGVLNVIKGESREGYIGVALGLACALLFFRFISEWRLKPIGESSKTLSGN
jgi:high-affinity Fe2+/Pb2+ permease